MLSRLDDVATAADMDAAGWKLHALKGELKGHWAVWIDGSWRWRNTVWLMPIAIFSVLASLLSIWTQRLEGGLSEEWHRTVPERIITAGGVVWAQPQRPHAEATQPKRAIASMTRWDGFGLTSVTQSVPDA